MEFQEILVLIIVLATVGYGGWLFYRKSRAFSAGSNCGSDCGCSSGSRRSHTARVE